MLYRLARLSPDKRRVLESTSSVHAEPQPNQLGDYEASAKAYRKSLEIEPGKAATEKSLRMAVSKLGARSTAAAATSTGAKAGDAKKAAGAEGEGTKLPRAKNSTGAERCYTEGPELSADGLNSPDMTARLREMMQTPGLRAQVRSMLSTMPVQQMVQHPAMMALVDNVMSNPAMMQEMMQATMTMLDGYRAEGGDNGPDLTGGGGGGGPDAGGAGGNGNADDEGTS